MTYIEFFDKTAVENVSTCLSKAPDRVIYVGEDKGLMEKQTKNYEKVFKGRGYDIEIVCVPFKRNDLEDAIKVLQKIVDEYEDCVFDITGGDEILTLALGIVYAKNPGRDIQIHKFNLRNNTIYDCDKDGETVFCRAPRLSVSENTIIYGGDIRYGSIDEERTYIWDLTSDFVRDINLIWDVCRKDVKGWNVQCILFEVLEKNGSIFSDGLNVICRKADFDAHIAKSKSPFGLNNKIIKALTRAGILTAFEIDDEFISLAYKNHQVKKCITKAGLALEMKVYVTARDILDENGEVMYNDLLNGVVMDWDGVIHTQGPAALCNTENEIDVLMMHGVVPIFVSCKNGVVNVDELYKLNTVANRFGDKYAKRVLVATSIPKNNPAGDYLRQRAKDMKIHLIEDLHKADDAEIKRKLKNLWQR